MKEIEKEGSFSINGLDIVVLPWDSSATAGVGEIYHRPTTARKLAKSIRAVQEPMLASHFGAEIMDHLFQRFMEIIADDTREVEHVAVLLSITRKWKFNWFLFFETFLRDTFLKFNKYRYVVSWKKKFFFNF